MEQIILLAIIAIVSSLFGKVKNKDQKEIPPSDSRPKPQSYQMSSAEKPQERPVIQARSFEDFAREVLGDMQDRSSQRENVEEVKRPIITEQIETVSNTVTSTSSQVSVEQPVASLSSRPNRGRLATGHLHEKKKTETSNHFTLPTSKQALMQAVVMAEVLGPPKAKRK